MWKLPSFLNEATITRGVGVLGMPGATAYGGLIDVLRPVQGETILVTAASGAVGALVGQIAKHQYGCKVIGTAGGPAKCELLKKMGFDSAIDYKTCDGMESLQAAIRAAAGSTGLNMVFENVGGAHFEAAFNCLGAGGRLAVCGAISQYNDEQLVKVSINQMQASGGALLIIV